MELVLYFYDLELTSYVLFRKITSFIVFLRNTKPPLESTRWSSMSNNDSLVVKYFLFSSCMVKNKHMQ
jgi:hypothetical protein